MPIKKSELYSSIWQSCDELRGGMDASQYKDYVLVLLFVKYVSDKAAARKGYLLDVPKGGSFSDMIALKGDKEIGDKMNKIVAKLAKPLSCLEYVVVHELLHLRVRHHDDRFHALMDQHLPTWRAARKRLNAAPLAAETWAPERTLP